MAGRGRMRQSWRARRADLNHAVPAPTGGPVAPPPSCRVPEGSPSALGSVPPWYEQLGAEVLDGLTFPWSTRLPGWTVCFLPGREGLLGGTWTYEHRIEIYVRAEQPRDDVAFTVAHELGHAVDVTLLDEADRLEWRRQRGLAGSVPWWVESGSSDLSSGSGDWAEAFAVWLVGGTSHSRVAPHPTAADLAAVARLSGETAAPSPAGELPTLAA